MMRRGGLLENKKEIEWGGLVRLLDSNSVIEWGKLENWRENWKEN